MPTDVDPATLFAFRAPRDAVAYLERKGYDTSVWNWFDVAADAHARSFTAAKATRLEVLQALRGALLQGNGERAFVRDLTPVLQKLGWWGKQIVVGADGGAEVAQLGSPHRLRTIYRTNTMSAYNAARYRQQVGDARSRPYWQYVAVMDGKTRASHAAMHGRIFRFDDPIWRTHYPPCAYNCRCRVRALSERDLERRGLKSESSAGQLQDIEQEAGTNKRTGEVVTMPATRWTGTDAAGRPVSMTPAPGFGANPGLVPWQPDLNRYDYDLARWYVGETLKGPAFARTWQRMEGAVAPRRGANVAADVLRAELAPAVVRGERYPVAVLSPADRALLDVRTQTVLLSDDTLLKQSISRAGQDFDLHDYWRVQPTIEQAQVVIRQGENVLVYVSQDDVWYHAAIKRSNDGSELFLTSFRRTDERGLRRAIRRGEVIRDER